MENIGINLQIRNMENRILQALIDFPDVPIEAKRVVIQGIESRIISEADKQTQIELNRYEAQRAEQMKVSVPEPENTES